MLQKLIKTKSDDGLGRLVQSLPLKLECVAFTGPSPMVYNTTVLLK